MEERHWLSKSLSSRTEPIVSSNDVQMLGNMETCYTLGMVKNLPTPLSDVEGQSMCISKGNILWFVQEPES